MKPPVFEYERPPNLRAALDALSKHAGSAKLLAGGQSLIPLLNVRSIAPRRLIDVGRLTELQYITEDYGHLRIGALTTHNSIFRSPIVAASCPIMVEAYQHVANHSIRNRGTLGGNLCHNDPGFEMPLVIALVGPPQWARPPSTKPRWRGSPNRRRGQLPRRRRARRGRNRATRPARPTHRRGSRLKGRPRRRRQRARPL
jgi:hypothetical protein